MTVEEFFFVPPGVVVLKATCPSCYRVTALLYDDAGAMVWHRLMQACKHEPELPDPARVAKQVARAHADGRVDDRARSLRLPLR